VIAHEHNYRATSNKVLYLSLPSSHPFWQLLAVNPLELAVIRAHNDNNNITHLADKEKEMKDKYFRSVLLVALAYVFLLSACASTPIIRSASQTPTRPAIDSPEPTATNTIIPTITLSPTVTPNLAATKQFEDFFSLVQKYYEADHISTTEGEYIELEDYQHEVANKLSYEWAETGVTAKNFIVRADFEWSNAINTTNTSGCGFVYRVQPNQDHYLLILDAFSGVKLASSTDRGTYSMGSPQNGDRRQSDFGSDPYQANFTLIVNDLKTYVYVNDMYQGEYKLLDYRITESGSLANAVLSATSTGYGTRCKMTNVRAWVIDP